VHGNFAKIEKFARCGDHVIGHQGTENLGGIISPGHGSHAETGLLGRLNVTGFIADIEDLSGSEFLFAQDTPYFAALSEELRGTAYEFKIGEFMPGQKGFDIGLRIGSENGKAFSTSMESCESLRHSGNRINEVDAFMEKLKSPVGNRWNPPAADAEMAYELPRIHFPGFFKLFEGEFPKSELTGHIIENSVGDRSRIGHGPVKIEEKDFRGGSVAIRSIPIGCGRETHE